MTSVFWFHRDHRISDNEALAAAHRAGPVLPVAVLVESWLDGLSERRAQSWIASLSALDSSIPSGLEINSCSSFDDVGAVLVEAMERVSAKQVFATRAFDPLGMKLQSSVGQALAQTGKRLILIGSNYAVEPGSVKKPDGTPYRVYSPFYKAWSAIGWGQPVTLTAPQWVEPTSLTDLVSLRWYNQTIRAGEDYAKRTFASFAKRALSTYDEDRNRADLAGTSHLSHALAHGEVHPRSLLVALGDSKPEETFRKELAWREFYADVLYWNPETQTEYLDSRFKRMRYDDGEPALAKFEAWRAGKTGYPMVDAGMRQLAETGWMHNRVRMIVASFLVKDLHLEWQRGAAHFEDLLTDFDPASNSHGWQWTAGCGTDASPYYRVFNPVLQGLKFDPDGNYVRKWIPELRHIDGPAVHEPWNLIDGGVHGYPPPIVDHATERDESLRRLEELKDPS